MDDLDHIGIEHGLYEWVESKTEEWRNHYEANYSDKHEEYYRLWRGQWREQDKTRASERSRIIAPALQQAVESSVAEIETASFSQAFMFDIVDDGQAPTPPPAPQGAQPQNGPQMPMQAQAGGFNPSEAAMVRARLHKDMERANYRAAIGEILINAAVYGTGIGELIIEDSTEYAPATQALDGMQGANLVEYGVEKRVRPIIKLNPVQPKNFLIDPNATCVSSALGVCVDEFVSIHHIQMLQESGVYRDDCDITEDPPEDAIEADSELIQPTKSKVHVKRYYGLVPTDLLIDEGAELDDEQKEQMYTEAVVVLGDGHLLKAIASPYMCQDRPICAFPWDVVPSRFWGRGVCEKGYMSQKALDAEMRARIDALALTTHPMMAVDATRIPRGDKFEVRPGKMLLTNGAPQEAIMPFNFGQLNQITFNQSQALQLMVQQATGGIDAGEMQKGPSSDTTAAGISMSMGAVMKRQRRTLVNFQESFFKPLIKKTAWRYMQFDPEKYPSKEYNFSVVSSLGVIAREYEVQQLAQILQVVPPQSPVHSAMVKAIIGHLNVTAKEELIGVIDQASQPNPEAQQLQQQAQQLEMALKQSQAAVLNAQAAEAQSRANKYNVESELMPQETVLKYADTDKDGKVDDDFEKRIRLAEMLLKEDQWNQEKEERAGKMQMEQQAMQQRQGDQDFVRQMLQQGQDQMSQVTIDEEPPLQ